MAADTSSQSISLSSDFETPTPVTPISPEVRSPAFDGGPSNESELVRQLRADLEVQRLIADGAMRSAEDARRKAEALESAVSERATLYQSVKALKNQLFREQEERKKQRDQADKAKDQSRAWVESLQEKLKGLREEKKSWLTEAVELRSEVAELKKTLAAQNILLSQEQNRAFKLTAQRLEDSPKYERVANFERRIDQLMAAQRLWADDIRKLNELQEFVDLKENEFQRLGQVLRGRIHEIDQLNDAVRDYEAEVAQLKGQLAAAQKAASKKALSPIALEYAAEARAAMIEMERQMEQLREQNELLMVRNEEQAEMLHDLRLQLESAQNVSTPLSTSDSLRLPSTKGTASTGTRSRRSSEDAGSHAPHLSLQLSPAAAVPPVLTTPLLGGIMSGHPTFMDDSMTE